MIGCTECLSPVNIRKDRISKQPGQSISVQLLWAVPTHLFQLTDDTIQTGSNKLGRSLSGPTLLVYLLLIGTQDTAHTQQNKPRVPNSGDKIACSSRLHSQKADASGAFARREPRERELVVRLSRDVRVRDGADEAAPERRVRPDADARGGQRAERDARRHVLLLRRVQLRQPKPVEVPTGRDVN